MHKFISDNFILFNIIGFVWIGFLIMFSAYRRKSKGKLIFKDPEVAIIFKEGKASGHSNKNFLTKIGGARNCLKVILSNNQLIVTPSFPFNMMFFPELYDLEHFIDYSNIFEIKNGSFGSLTISFNTTSGINNISLRLKNKDGFINIITTKIGSNKIAI